MEVKQLKLTVLNVQYLSIQCLNNEQPTPYRLLKHLVSIALVLLVVFAKAQTYPVQLNTALMPPYSVYLEDYMPLVA